MSDYCRMKVLRLPFEHTGLRIEDYDDIGYELHEQFGEMFHWCGKSIGKFDFAPTEDPFIDFILEDVYGDDCGEWGKVRALTAAEKEKYLPVFSKLNPNIDMDKVRLVEFCWYNCSEAPSYYSMDKGKDPFYDEVPFVCNFALE